MSKNGKPEPTVNIVDTSDRFHSRSDKVTRGFFIVLISLVLLVTPVLVSLSLLFRTGFRVVFSLWSLVTVLVLILLCIFSIYATLREEALKSKERNLAELKHDLTYLFRYKHIVVPIMLLSFAAGLGNILHFISALFSLELIYSAVIILVLVSVFHSISGYLPKILRENSRVQNSFLIALIIVGLFLSLFVIGAASVLVISIIFAGIILVAGIGLAFVPEILASDLSRIQFRKKNSSYASLLIAFLLLTVWTWFSSDFVAIIFRYTVTLAVPSVHELYASEFQALLTGLNISFLSLLAALITGTAYLLYFSIRRNGQPEEGRLVFLLTSIPVSGFIIFCLAIVVHGDWTASISTGNSFISYIAQFLPSIALFVVGYSQVMIEVPRKTSRLLLLGENKLIISLTWLMIFSAIAEFLSWTVYGRPGSFIFEVDVVQWFGIPIGLALLSVKYVRKRRARGSAAE